MNNKYVLFVIAFVAGLFLAQGAMATLSFDILLPNLNFTEGGSITLDLDDNPLYLNTSLKNGSIVYTVTGNSSVTVSIDAATNIVTFDTTDDNFSGQETITIEAVDDDLLPVSDELIITVDPVNDAPIFDGLPTELLMYEDIAFSYDVTQNVSDVDIPFEGDTLTVTADARDWTEFTMTNGVISFTPDSSDFGLHEVEFTVTDSNNLTATQDVMFRVTEICEDDALIVSSFSWEDDTGDDDELWPGDELTIEFDLENEISKDMEDIELTAWVEDIEGKRISEKVELDKFDLNAKDSEDDIEMTLKIDPDTDADDYYIVIEVDADDEDGDAHCENFYEPVEVERDTHAILVDSITFAPETVSCKQPVEITADVYNIGKKNEDVKLRFRNSELNLDEYSELFELKDSGSKADTKQKLTYVLPGTAFGSYVIEVIAEYNNGDKSSSTEILEVACESPEDDSEDDSSNETTGQATTALDKTATTGVAEQRVKFTMTLTNSGSSEATYSVESIADWASVDIEPSTVTLAGGSSIPVYLYVEPNAGVSGEHTAVFSIKSNDEVVSTEVVSMNVLTSGSQITGAQVTDLTGSGKTIGLGEVFSGGVLQSLSLLFVAVLALLAMILYSRKTQPQVEVIMGKPKKKRR